MRRRALPPTPKRLTRRQSIKNALFLTSRIRFAVYRSFQERASSHGQRQLKQALHLRGKPASQFAVLCVCQGKCTEGASIDQSLKSR